MAPPGPVPVLNAHRYTILYSEYFPSKFSFKYQQLFDFTYIFSAQALKTVNMMHINEFFRHLSLTGMETLDRTYQSYLIYLGYLLCNFKIQLRRRHHMND